MTSIVERAVEVLFQHRQTWSNFDNTEASCECGYLLWQVGFGFTDGPVEGGDIARALLRHQAQALADAGLLATEPRAITSAEELDALPVGSVIRDHRTAVWERNDPDDGGDFLWTSTDGNGRYRSATFESLGDLPATVLYVPTGAEVEK